MQEIKKVVIIGPESTGKSTLSAQLAAHYNTIWVEEYAREYLLKNDTVYTFENLLDVAKGQVGLEEKAVSQVKSEKLKVKNEAESIIQGLSPFTSHLSPIFFDTDMYVMKVWCEYVFGKCHQFILDEIAVRKYDLYLLCNIDLPWIKDELREYPDEKPRQELYHIYKDIMINQSTPWVDISGDYEERLSKAIAAVDKIFSR